MGVNSSKRLAAKCSFLSKDEQVIISNSFRLASKNSEKIKEDDLIKLWGSQMDARLSQYIANYLFEKSENRQQTVEFEKFAEMYVFCTRGTVDERLAVILQCLRKGSPDDNTDVTYILVKEFVESVVSTYMKIQKTANTKQFKSWTSRGSFTSPQNVQKFAESLTSELAASTQSLSEDQLRQWIQLCTTFTLLLHYVFGHLYSITHREKEKDREKPPGVAYYPHEDYEMLDKEKDKSLIPFCRGLDLIPSYPSLLDLNQLVFINSNLPTKYQYEWRFLFSSEIHGESFSTLIGRIINQGPSVLIVEDKNGYMFGGFAPESWNLSPNWVGDDNSFLFTLTPKMRVFHSSGYNDHYQYLNLHQQTMPNGLLMGGQFNYGGLWLDSEYGLGLTSETCTTYKGYIQLSQQKEFTYRHLEVWGLGNPAMSPQGDNTGTSILDHSDGKKLLEMAGKTIHSDGYREPPNT